MDLVINGQARTVPLSAQPTVAELVRALGMQADRVALERNGEIVARGTWETAAVADADRFEIVHFVGGGITGIA